MNTAVCYWFGKPLVVEEIEVDPPQMVEGRVRIAAALASPVALQRQLETCFRR